MSAADEEYRRYFALDRYWELMIVNEVEIEVDIGDGIGIGRVEIGLAGPNEWSDSDVKHVVCDVELDDEGLKTANCSIVGWSLDVTDKEMN